MTEHAKRDLTLAEIQHLKPEFIKRAVNCHDELVASLTEITHRLGRYGWNEQGNQAEKNIRSGMLKRANATLAKARQ